MEFTEEEIDRLNTLLENEINSTMDYLNDVKGKEREVWREHILALKNIQSKIKPVEVIIA